MTEEEKKKFLATAGAVVAFVAAIAFGGYKLHQVLAFTCKRWHVYTTMHCSAGCQPPALQLHNALQLHEVLCVLASM